MSQRYPEKSDVGCLIYNPGLLDQHTASYQEIISIKDGRSEWLDQLSRFRCKTAESDFFDYGARMIQLADHLNGAKPDCSLGPLRGASKPCVLAEVMTKGAVTYDFFNFRANSDAANHPRIRADLEEIIRLRDPEENDYRINITDVVRGGQGINNLIGFLKEIKSAPRYQKQRWILDLNLIHDSSPNTHLDRINSVQSGHLPGAFEINLQRYQVPNLIVEDYDEALAVELFFDGRYHRFKPCTLPGQFLYRVGDDLRLIETEDCYKTFEVLYSTAITQGLLTSPDHAQAGYVWNEYQNK
jgi:hypothetical protein